MTIKINKPVFSMDVLGNCHSSFNQDWVNNSIYKSELLVGIHLKKETTS